MGKTLNKYFEFLTPNESLATDIIAGILKRTNGEDTEYFGNLVGNAFPTECYSNLEFIDVLKGTSFNPNKTSGSSDLKDLEFVLAIQAYSALLSKVSEDITKLGIPNTVQKLQGKTLATSYTILNNDMYIENFNGIKEVANTEFGVNIIENLEELESVDAISEFDSLYLLKSYLEANDLQVSIKVQKSIDRLLLTLETLYAPLWKSNYVTFLVNNGGVADVRMPASIAQSYQEKGLFVDNSLVNELVYSWNETQNEDLDSILGFDNNSLYFERAEIPGFHTNNLQYSKKDAWSKIRKFVEQEAAKKFVEIEKSCGADNKEYQNKIDTYIFNVTRAAVVTSYSKHTIQLRVGGIKSFDDIKALKESISEKLTDYLHATPSITYKNIKVGDSGDNLGIYNITCIYDEQAFIDETLFAYKIYEDNPNYKPSLQNTIIGQNLDGSLLTINLDAEESKSILITAGSRSGKGVMTMSLMAAAMGAGSSLIYLDHKPDISAMLWQLEQKFAAIGEDVKFLAMDTKSDVCAFNKMSPPRYCEVEIPFKNLGFTRESLRFVRTLKTFQALEFLYYYHSQIPGYKKGNIYVVVDELTILSDAEVKFKSELHDAKKKASAEGPEAVAYVSKLEKLYESAKNSLNAGVNANWAVIGVKLIMIGQEINEKWNPEADFVNGLLSTTKSTIAGRYQVTLNTEKDEDGNIISSNPLNYKLTKDQAKLADKRGVFAYHKGKPFGVKGCRLGSKGIPVGNGTTKVVSDFVQFRSYFTLVDNDLNVAELEGAEDKSGYFRSHQDKYTSEFLKGNVGSPKFDDMLNELRDPVTGEIRDRVGFFGLINIVRERIGLDMSTFAQNLNVGYSNMDAMFRALHLDKKFNCIEEYLISCDPESFLNVDTAGVLIGQQVIKEEGSSVNFGDLLTYQTDEEKTDSWNSFLRQFTLLCGPVGAEISNLKSKLAKCKDEEIFNNTKQDFTSDAAIEAIVEKFNPAFDIVRDNSKLLEDARIKAREFVNGRLASVLSMTFADTTQEKREAEREEERARKEAEKEEERVRKEIEKAAQQGQGQQGYTPQGSSRPPFTEIPHIDSVIDTGDMEYTEENGGRDLNTLEKVSDMIIEDVFNQFGNDIFSIGVNANGGLIVNNTGYSPSFGEAFMRSIQSKPYIVAQLNRGNLSVVADMGYIIRNLMGDSQQLSVEYPRFAKDNYFWNQIGAKNRDCGKLFKKYPNLETINICGEILTRDNMYEDSPSSGGLLSNLFGLNKNPRVPNPHRKEVDSNSITNRIFSSKPVRVMANAFGWTMGVKAVMLATTIFGPIGLLFGAFAAVGAVKELKNDNQNSQYSTNKPNSNFSRTASNSNRGKQKSNKNRQNRSNGSYNPMTGQSNRSQSRSRSNDDFDGYDE